MPKIKITPFHPYETTKITGIEERYIRKGNSQMLNDNYRNLSHSAYRVLDYMKLESGGKPVFEFPYSKFKKIISKQGFQSAKKELVDKGFIDILEQNANLRKPNIYRFSERWKFIEKP